MSEAAETAIDTPITEAVETTTAEPTDVLANVESAAKAGGWVPKDEFTGPPDKWLDAPNFVLKAAEILPNVTRDLREARNEIREVKKTLKDFGEFHSQTAQREYQRAIKEIEGRLTQAHVENDLQGVMDASEDLADLKAEAKAGKDTAPKDGDLTESEQQAFDAWKGQNPWYGKDAELTEEANLIGSALHAKGIGGAEQAAEVSKRIRKLFPEKFENPNRKLPGAVEAGGNARHQRGKSYSDLPPDAKKMCDEFVRDIKGFTKEKFVADYDWS